MKSIEQLRRDAKALRAAFEAGDVSARMRMESVQPKRSNAELKHADYLHVIAREHGFGTWPRLVFAVQLLGMDSAQQRQKLLTALFHGQNWRVEKLLEQTPDLAAGDFHLACAFYDLEAVQEGLKRDPDCAVERVSDRSPVLWLAGSKWFQSRPDLEARMLAVADLLLAHGADVNDGIPMPDGHRLSALYLALGSSNNMPLSNWLLEHGADPNDNESLYHATELGHHDGLKLLLKHGADPTGTNALLRAMDFDDIGAVKLLLDAGADVGDYNAAAVGGELPWVYPALHQAARRMCSREMVELVLDAGADPTHKHDGMTAYALARAFGNHAVAAALEARNMATLLNEIEQQLADLADGVAIEGCLDPERLPKAVRNIVRSILHLPGKKAHVERLVAAGAEYDRPDAEGLTPVQVAGWEGLPEMLDYFLSRKPDLTHVNNYGGTLLSTIIHGSENNPERAGRDHVECLRLALDAGVALPVRAAEMAGEAHVAAFLADWAETHPEQVVRHGVV